MTLMALGRSPEVWAAGVELFGIINWMTMLEHSDPMLQEYEKSLLGDPVKDRAAYDAASPITYIHNRSHGEDLVLSVPPSASELIAIRRCFTSERYNGGVFGHWKNKTVRK